MENERSLKAFDIGIDTHQELVIYMRLDCHICRSEGFTASSRVLIRTNSDEAIATINTVDNKSLPQGVVGVSKIVFQRLQIKSGDHVTIHHAPVVESLSAVRKKIYGHTLNRTELERIVEDINAHRYSDIEISSFLSICAGGRLNLDEIIYLTKAMVDCGHRLEWAGEQKVFDKHCIGGIPGNRTTPLVVSIVSAAGLLIPKTSSRAITSPAGTADTMEVLTRVDLDIREMKAVVETTGACLAWGGAVNLSPADDLLIRIERALDLDGEGQLIASVLSKKIAAGSTHTVIDIPVGATAKVRNKIDADRLSYLFTQVGQACGLQVRCVITDGSRPIGMGIGPVEEARDLLAVLQGRDNLPSDLLERAILLSGHLFDLALGCGLKAGKQKAVEIVKSGRAWQQFKKIVDAQGGMEELPRAEFVYTVNAREGGRIYSIDNRRLARLAKLAGAPISASAGLRLRAKVGDILAENQPMFELYCETEGELEYALEYYQKNQDLILIEEE